jgi:hypothetical protein
MTPSDYFMQHAADCEFMAKLAREPESKAVWIGMARRWHRCAAFAQEQSAHQREQQAQRRKSAKTCSH